MDSDDSNISDHVGDLDIQSYQFEPLCNDESQQEREHSTSEDSDIDESSQAQDRLVNTDWCECGNCSSMTTPEECICCVEVPAVHSQMLSEDMQCITDSDIFISNCLNRHVLHVSMYEFLENVGPFDDSEPINEQYRFMAYRPSYSGFGTDLDVITGQILPTCVVQKIRETFPSEEYCGFKYATV